MDWRTKSRVIGLIEKMPLPWSGRVYYLLQKHLTHSIPRSAASIESVIEYERRHLAAFAEYSPKKLPDDVFEFGAGWDLCSALVRQTLGVPHQKMVDLHHLASTWQINHVAAYLKCPPISSINDLEAMGISYVAPLDACETGYVEGSIDLITSTNTLEHIGIDDLRSILRECCRILASSGVASMFIDYSDHYSHADGTIGAHNFLQFSDKQWEAHNHPEHHYQNRLRHCDYTELFEEAGFEILESTPVVPTDPSLPTLDHRFLKYDPADLIPTSGHFVLKKRSNQA